MFDELTKRELQVLDLFAHGCSSEMVQEKLRISSYTVQSHLNHIYEKNIDILGSCERDSTRQSKKVCLVLLYLKHIGVLKKDWEVRI